MKESTGLSLWELAQFMQELGCVTACNPDREVDWDRRQNPAGAYNQKVYTYEQIE